MIDKICSRQVEVEYLYGDDMTILEAIDKQQIKEFIENDCSSGQFESHDSDDNLRTVAWSIE